MIIKITSHSCDSSNKNKFVISNVKFLIQKSTSVARSAKYQSPKKNDENEQKVGEHAATNQ